jgi:predicted ATPase/DNA-binding SARP family transcriptional activator
VATTTDIATRLDVGVLGDLAVRASGRAVEIGGPVPRRLFCHLALRRNAVLSREELVDRLWGDEPPDTADKSLQVYVSRIRRALSSASDRLTTSAAGYRLALDDHELDLARADWGADAAEDALLDARYTDAVARASAALELWRGPALPDLHDLAALGHKAQIDGLRVRLESARIDGEIGAGLADVAIARLELLVREHPIRERLWVQLMFALYAAGRQGDALATYLRARSVLDEELGTDPGPELTEAHRLILEQRPRPGSTLSVRSGRSGERAMDLPVSSAGAPRGVVRLPTFLDATYGRSRSIDEVAGHVKRGRLVTLVGPGGVGKTRLAVEVAHRVAGGFPAGCAFIDLSAVHDPDQLLQALLADAEPGAAGEEALPERVAAALGDGDVLLVLDNLEQVVAGAPAIAALLQAASRLHVLATSRAPLRVRGEVVVQVTELPVGVGVDVRAFDDPDGHPAVALLAARARAAGAIVRADDAGLAAEICARLDGLPLALELVAVRSRTLGLGGVLAQMRAGLAGAEDGPRDLPERHRTLHAVVAWSVGLLGPEARGLFPRLSLLAGTFDLAAILAVGRMDLRSSIASVAELVEHSLVQRADDGATGPRYRLLATIRQEAAALLDDASATDATAAALGHWRDIAATLGGQVTAGDQAAAISRLEADLPSIRAALDRVEAAGLPHLPDAIAIVTGLRRFWHLTGRSPEARALLLRFLQLAPADLAPDLRAQALNHVGTTYLAAGQHRLAAPYLEEALVIRRTIGDPSALSATVSNLSLVRRWDGDLDGMREMMEEAVALSREAGDDWGVAAGLGNLGVAALESGDHDAAERWYREALAVFEDVGDQASVGMVLDSLGTIAAARADYGRALVLLERSLGIARALGDAPSMVASGINLARVRLLAGDAVGARTIAEEVTAPASEIGDLTCTEVIEVWAQVAVAEGRDTDATLLIAVAARRRERGGWALPPHDRIAWHDGLVAGLRRRLGEEAAVRIMGDALVVDGTTLLAAQVSQRPV